MEYIGTKLVEARPAIRFSTGSRVGIIPDGDDLDKELLATTGMVQEGYQVTYPGGYVSWCPKDVFERAYLPLTYNEDLPDIEAPSISQEMVDDFVRDVEVMRMGSTTTVVKAVLRNGFTIVEASSCVSPENYDEGIGTAICMEKIKDQVWMLLGFLLETAVNGVGQAEERAEQESELRDPDEYIRRDL